MAFLPDKNRDPFDTKTKNIEEIADEILSKHSFDFSSFEDAKITITTQDIEYCFDRLSLCVYQHNLGTENFWLLGKILTAKYEERFNREAQKARLEYGILFHMMVLNEVYSGASIFKKTQPDFVLEYKGERIGVEVTEFTTPQDKVLATISRQNFGMGKDISKIQEDAIKKHGNKAAAYAYICIDELNAIGRPLFDVEEQHRSYADEVIKKYKLYKDSFSQYDKFIVLCNGQNSMCMSSIFDSKNILLFAKEKEQSLSCFTLNILRQDDSGQCVLDSFDI